MVSRQEAAQELTLRRQARKSLLHFTNYTYPQYRAEAVHALMADALDGLVEGRTKRLMIFAPPQHGKSELTSVRLPAYWLGRRPDEPIILASYGADLAYSKSRQARQIVEGAEFKRLFPEVATNPSSRAVNNWELLGRRGGMLAAGVGGPITGHGAMLGIIDDPFENWEQAQSPTYRERAWEWYRTTFRTRVWEAGAIVLIMTRWHEDDLAGRLMLAQPGAWDVLRLPALAETQADRDFHNLRMGLAKGQRDPLRRRPGQALAPGRYSAEALAQLKTDVGSLAWSAEYQGAPTVAEGNRFKRSWFEIVEAAPAGGRWVRYWDKAATADGGAHTAGVLIGCIDKTYYIADVRRGQWSAGERDRIMVQTAQMDGTTVQIVVEQEPGSGGKESAEASIRMLAGFPVYADRVTGDKDTRLEPFAAQCEAGNVKLVRGPWNMAFLDELAAIPSGRYRDQSDAAGGAFNKLARRLDGRLVG